MCLSTTTCSHHMDGFPMKIAQCLHTHLLNNYNHRWVANGFFTYVSLVMIDCIGKLVVPILVSMKKLEWNQKVDFWELISCQKLDF